MIWSKLKKTSEAMLADSLQGRVHYHTTRYGDGTNNSLRRGWITFEGREIASFSNIEKVQKQQEANVAVNISEPQGNEPPDQHLVHSRDEFVAALEAIVNTQVEEALASENHILRALAMLDRRLGKRRLIAMVVGDDEDELVRMLYRLRCRT